MLRSLMSNYTPDKSIMHLNFLPTKHETASPSLDTWLPNYKPMIPRRSDTSVKISNWQIRSDPGPSAAPSELLLLLLLPACCCCDCPCLHALITPDVRRTGHKKLPTPAAWTKARPDSLSPDPSHFAFIVCLTGFDRPRPKPSTLWPSLSSSRFSFCQQCHKKTKKQTKSTSVLCVPTIQQGGVCVKHTHADTHADTKKLSPTDGSMCGYQLWCQVLHHQAPYHCSFTEGKTDSATEEIRWKKEKQTAGPVGGCDRLWPSAEAEGTFGGGSQGRALRWGQTHTHTGGAEAVRITLDVFPLAERETEGRVVSRGRFKWHAAPLHHTHCHLSAHIL